MHAVAHVPPTILAFQTILINMITSVFSLALLFISLILRFMQPTLPALTTTTTTIIIIVIGRPSTISVVTIHITSTSLGTPAHAGGAIVFSRFINAHATACLTGAVGISMPIHTTTTTTTTTTTKAAAAAAVSALSLTRNFANARTATAAFARLLLPAKGAR